MTGPRMEEAAEAAVNATVGSLAYHVTQFLAKYAEKDLGLVQVEDVVAAVRQVVDTAVNEKDIATLIEAINFEHGVYSDLPYPQWPRERGDLGTIFEDHPNRVIFNSELLAVSEGKGEFVSPIDVLRRVKRERPKYPVATLFWVGEGENKQLWFLCVSILGGRLALYVRRRGLDHDWTENVRFLRRPK